LILSKSRDNFSFWKKTKNFPDKRKKSFAQGFLNHWAKLFKIFNFPVVE
jgi:hypothetical protein